MRLVLIVIFWFFSFCSSFAAKDVNLNTIYELRNSSKYEMDKFIKTFDWIIDAYYKQKNVNELSYVNFKNQNNAICLFYSETDLDNKYKRVLFSFTDATIYATNISAYLEGKTLLSTRAIKNGFSTIYKYKDDIVVIKIVKLSNDTYNYDVWLYSERDYIENIQE